MDKRGLIVVLLVLIFAGFVFASSDSGEPSHSLTTSYGPGQAIKGWINVSIQNEAIDKEFKDNQGNKISLLALLRNDSSLKEGKNYSCSPSGCGLSFVESSPQTSKTVNIPSGNTQVLGFKVVGNPITELSIDFNLSTNVGASCGKQLEVDYFLDGNDYVNSKAYYLEESCPSLKNKGCYNQSLQNSTYSVSTQKYCQKVRLSESPGFRLSAWVQRTGTPKTTKIGLYTLSLSPIAEGTCNLPNTITTEELSCEVNYTVTNSADYYVCIYNEEGADFNTKIRGYQIPNGCGVYDASPNKFSFDFSVEGRKYAPIGEIATPEDLGADALNYIRANINKDANCASGCLIPIAFSSEVSQEITLKDVNIEYNSPFPTQDDKVYTLETSTPLLSTSGFQKISLDGVNFLTPSSFGPFEYTLDFNGDELFSEDLFIEKVPIIKSLNPTTTINAVPTNFEVAVDLADNSSIKTYFWKVGNKTETTTQNKYTHTFFTPTTTSVSVMVTDNNGKTASKTFQVKVEGSAQYIADRITTMKNNLNNISNQILKFPVFNQNAIKSVVDLTDLNARLTAAETKYEQTKSDTQSDGYIESVNEIISLDIPSSVYESLNTGKLSFYPQNSKVSVVAIKDALGGNYDIAQEELYKDSVANWDLQNFYFQIEQTQISGDYEDSIEPLASIYKLSVKPKSSSFNTESYIFIKEISNLNFLQDYGKESVSGYVKIPVGNGIEITFSGTDDINFLELPVFVSPSLTDLELLGEIPSFEKQGFKVALFILIIFFLLIAGTIVYIILQNWYKNKYETYLFKDRNFLFNLIHYMENSKRKGMSDSEIYKKLKKAGWTSEQVNYATKKYLGKRTGMFEIPIEKLMNIFSKKENKIQAIKKPQFKGVQNVPRGPGASAGVPPRKSFFRK